MFDAFGTTGLKVCHCQADVVPVVWTGWPSTLASRTGDWFGDLADSKVSSKLTESRNQLDWRRLWRLAARDHTGIFVQNIFDRAPPRPELV
jgi:hypothetical protein